ncbi:MAG: ABC transporter permease [Spirochaetota bacterium]
MSPSPNPIGLVKKYLAILILAPFLILVTLFLLLGYGLHGFPIAVANEDSGFDMPMVGPLNIPETLVKALDPGAFAITRVAKAAEAQALYDSGKVKALLVFPAELTKNMMIKQDDPSYVLPDRFRVEVSGDNPLVKLFALATIARSSFAAMAESGGGISADSLPLPLDIEALASGFGGAGNYMLSGILGFIAYFLTGIASLFALLSLRKEGRLVGIGVGRFASTFVLSFGLAGWILYLGLALAVSAILGVALAANFLPASLVLLLLFSTAAGLALAAGTNVPSTDHARAAIPYLILPLFFGGFLFPVELLPVWLQWLPWIFPPSYGLPAALALGASRSAAWIYWSIGVSAVWAAAFLALGMVGLKRRAVEKIP